MSSRSTAHEPTQNDEQAARRLSAEDLRALLLLRMLRVPDAKLNELLLHDPPAHVLRHLNRQPIPPRIEGRVAAALRDFAALRIGVITVADAAYPETLHELQEVKPPILFYRGDLALMQSKIVAIVGTRRSTEYGNDVAETFAGELTRYGITIASGLARGVDAHAHAGALEAGGRTLAVLGCGINVLYPQRNARLQERIAQEGLLLSEFAPGEPAMRHHFLQRNRLIAKLAGAVIVVEAGVRSGSLNTASWATRYNVAVFAIPGPIGRDASRGTNALLYDGAKFATSVRDVLDELPWRVTRMATSPEAAPAGATFRGTAARVLNMLGPVGMQIDQIARAAGCNTADALAALAELELEGVVRQLAGKRFVRTDLRTAD